MKKLAAVFCLAAAAMLAMGCSSISSTQSTANNHWIVKNTGLGAMGLGLILSSEVYYCPPNGGKCKKAKGL